METSAWIAHSKPFFDATDERALLDVLRRRYVTHGPVAEELGRRGAEMLGKKWGIAVQSGTDALTACLKLLGVGRGSRVVIPSYICSAPLDALSLLGAEPVVVDVTPQTLSIDPAKVNDVSAPDAVLAAHLFGIPGSFDAIECRNLIEDCAQSIGLTFQGRKTGARGRLSFCSFYGTKLAAAGHGGVLAGNEPDLEEAAHDLFTHDGRGVWTPHFHFYMSDLAASLALSQLEKLDRLIDERRDLALLWSEALGAGDIPPDCAYSRFLVETEDAERLIARFRQAEIEAKRPVYSPVHRVLQLPAADFPVAEWAHQHIVSVPLYPGMSDREVQRVTSFLKEHAHEMRRRPSG